MSNVIMAFIASHRMNNRFPLFHSFEAYEKFSQLNKQRSGSNVCTINKVYFVIHDYQPKIKQQKIRIECGLIRPSQMQNPQFSTFFMQKLILVFWALTGIEHHNFGIPEFSAKLYSSAQASCISVYPVTRMCHSHLTTHAFTKWNKIP